MSDPQYNHNYLARVIRDQHTGTVMLQILTDEGVVDIADGDEFVTLGTVVDLREVPSL